MRKFYFFLTSFSFPVFLIGQNVGIGTPAPLQKLHVEGTTFLNGNVGISNNSPVFPLSFSTDLGDKISLWSNSPNSYGFGIQSTLLQIHTDISASDIVFGYGSSASLIETMRIKGNGNVGIGTAPTHRLHVNATTDFELAKFNGGNRMYLGFYENNTQRGYLGSYQTANAEDFEIGTSTNNTTGKLHLTTLAASRATIDESGNMGVGTTTPGVRLHVASTNSEVLRVQGAGPYVSLYDNAAGYKGFFWYNGSDVVLGSGSTGVRFVTNNFYRMSIHPDGRVSIGTFNTAATGYLLSVDGKIICTEARVQNSGAWPDYVFKNTYRLLPLDEVEKHIKVTGHLPGIPAASTVQKEGFDLGDMNKRLLEKIEELTLYIIELNKENKAMNERLRKLEEK